MKYKNYCAIMWLIVLCNVCAEIHAQSNKWQIGLNGGPQWSKFGGNLDPEYKAARFNANFGIQTNYSINKWFAINASLNYQGKGSKSKDNLGFYDPVSGNGSSFGRLKFNYDYITMPILAQFTYGQKIKYSVAFGPYIAYRYAVHRYLSTGNVSSLDLNSYIANNPKLDYGLTFSLGVSYPINNKVSIISFLKEDYGIRNLSKDKTYTLRNQAFSFNLGLNYRL